MQPAVDTWKTMRRLEREWQEERLGSFVKFVMERLQCPSYQDAELAVANYEDFKNGVVRDEE